MTLRLWVRPQKCAPPAWRDEPTTWPLTGTRATTRRGTMRSLARRGFERRAGRAAAAAPRWRPPGASPPRARPTFRRGGWPGPRPRGWPGSCGCGGRHPAARGRAAPCPARRGARRWRRSRAAGRGRRCAPGRGGRSRCKHGRFQEEAARIQAGHQERGRHSASLRRGTRTGNARGLRSDSGHHALAAAAETEDLLEAVGEPALETEQGRDAVVVEHEPHVAAAALAHVLDEEPVAVRCARPCPALSSFLSPPLP